jgi:hypothetical protein
MKLSQISSIRICLLLLSLLGNPLFVFSQNDSTNQVSSSIELQIFADAEYETVNNDNGDFSYNIKRTLLVYNQDLSNHFSFCLAGDSYAIDKNKTFKRDFYLKRAYLNYTKKNISITTGLLVTEEFKFQRKILDMRYIDKTFRNKFAFGENRNTGILFKHKINQNHTYDIAFTTGHITPFSNNTNYPQIMGGQTFSRQNWSFRHFHSLAFDTAHENIHSLFISKEFERLTFALESSAIFNENNQTTEDYYGISVFSKLIIHPRIKCFFRYDMNHNMHTSEIDKQYLWAGVELSPSKYIRASIFYKSTNFESNYFGIAMFVHFYGESV